MTYKSGLPMSVMQFTKLYVKQVAYKRLTAYMNATLDTPTYYNLHTVNSYKQG